jgi:hypothetical protein
VHDRLDDEQYKAEYVPEGHYREARCQKVRCLSWAGSSISRKTGLVKAVKHISEPTSSPIQAVVAIFSNGTVSKKDIVRPSALKRGYPEVHPHALRLSTVPKSHLIRRS